ncbi:proteasome maturation factor UMP1 family protein [Cavenderia fasciculata]|uniref:Proteasome maturation factor UMP1 family protein n=1 Tax=Cavenderia fasciculata TaxID=261658 RepID=F4PWK9_CACFS|nr:proteasome maturation factor UMP1 family protein [Cavenderia fasciculata]EGG20373.1 proteasome maturation factor UMP1 family protein [Cavenderia fasciculata]|eukprot:XP_004367356.1 proteasome maturation factor UMP1 family protein [Cavenderia fasciculata]
MSQVKTSIDLPDLVSHNTSNVQRYSHPVESIQRNQYSVDTRLKTFAASNVFGQHMVLHNEIEKQIYSQFKRLPTLNSSMIALETVLGLDEDIDFEDYLNDPLMSETPLPTLHSQMETKLGIAMPKSII